jgi:lactate dehydrogenase-like 2-hydroxyacid dehydrogenase
VISSFGVGLDKLDVRGARARGIPVGYTPDVLNDCVADLAFGLLLAIGAAHPEGDRFVRAGRWAAQPADALPAGPQVSGAKLGIVGLGRIGRTIASAPAASTWTCVTTAASRWKAWPGATSRSCWSWRAGPTSWW